MDPLYNRINEGLASLGIEYRVDNLAEVAGGLVAAAFAAWFLLHLIFDD